MRAALAEARVGLGAGEVPVGAVVVVDDVIVGRAVIQARLARVVYGAPDPRAGAVESRYRLLDDGRLNHRVEALGGVLGAECGALLKEFFETKRG